MDVKISHQDLCHIKALTKTAVAKIGGQDAAGLFCGTSTAMMSNYSNVELGHTIPLHILIPLMRTSNDHGLLHFLAGQFDYRLTPKNKREVTVKDILQVISTFQKEGSEAVTVGLQGLLDGKLDRHELQNMEQEALEAINAGQDMLTLIQTLQSGDKV